MESTDEPKRRKRTKQLINTIKDLVEFYFGDANLRHDRFLRKEIEDSKEGYIKLETLLKFNKIKELSTDLQVIVKAIENSKLLNLSEDKKNVFRCNPIQPLNMVEADSRTVYVEQLYAFTDHEWLRQVFSACGKVQYISLPRYKQDDKIKGFAFIEYECPEEAETACKILNTAERKSTPMNEEKTTPKGNNRKRRRSVSISEAETSTNKNVSPASTKRRRAISECSNENGSPSKTKKKRKTSIEERLLSDLKGQIKSSTEKKEPENKDRQQKTTISHSQKDKDESIRAGEGSSKEKDESKKRKRNHSKKDKEDSKDIVVPPLYVISKKEWTTLKRQYKHLQRKEFQNLKKTTKILKSELVRRKELKEKLGKDSEGDKSQKLTAPLTKTVIGKKRKIEENLSNTKVTEVIEVTEHEEPTVKKAKPENQQYQLEPGSTMSVSTELDTLTKNIIKETLSSFAKVAYVDYLNGSLKGFVRFQNAEECKKIKQLKDKENWKFKIEKLKDEEEKAYFEKAIEDRKKTYQLNEKKKKKRLERGPVKVLKQAESLTT